MKRFALAAGAAALLALSAGTAPALETAPQLSLAIAKRMADACVTMANHKNWKMNIAVVDAGANLILFQRMDGAFLGSVDIALAKAKTSARFPFPTRAIGELAFGKDGNAGPVPGIAHVEGIIAFAGGLPIRGAGAHVGAIGVSGGSADEDEACAQAALDAVAEDLKKK